MFRHAEEHLRLVIDEDHCAIVRVNRPLSVEFRLIHLCSRDFDFHRKNMTPHFRAGYWTKRSDFRAPKDWSDTVPFGGVEFGKKSGRYRGSLKRKGTTGQNGGSNRYAGISIFRIWLEQNDRKASIAGPVRGDCDGDCFRAAENVQLGEDVAQMPFHCGLADEEIAPISLLLLPRASNVNTPSSRPVQGFAAHCCCELFHQRLRYASVAAVHLPDTIQQFFASSVF